MQYEREDPGFDRVATIDIETTHYEPEQGETVSVGIGVHDRGTTAAEASYETYHREGDDETELIETTLRRLDRLDADGLVSYNGKQFDLAFLEGRLRRLGGRSTSPSIDTRETHVDLFRDRKRSLPRSRKWPSLEECLASYGIEPAETRWRGDAVDNSRFGRELGPAYLEAVSRESTDERSALSEVIDHYLITDLEANFALFYADIGAPFEPVQLGTTREF